MAAKPSIRRIAVSNQKGGEGKTTTAVNLAASLAAAEKRVLLLDIDPQGNASSALGYPRSSSVRGTYELLGGASLSEVVHNTDLPSLFVVPATPDLAGAEIELVNMTARERVLAKAFHSSELTASYDFIIIDCPPSLGLLTLNALVAVDAVLIAMQAKYFSLEGLSALTETIAAVREHYNPSLSILGILFCLFDPRTNLSQQVVQEVETHFPGLAFSTRIPVNVRLSESPSFGKPVLLYDIESKGAKAYFDLTHEFLARIAKDE